MKMKRVFCRIVCALLIAGLLPVQSLAEEPKYSRIASEVKAQIQLPDKCTGVYVGKDACLENTRLIGRSEDQGCGNSNKLFFVEPASNKAGREMVDTGFYQRGFSVPLPDHTYRYTYLKDSALSSDGPYYACCMNECGLAVVGTVTTKVSPEYARIDPVQYSGHGLREAILPGLIACQAKNCAEAVEVLAGYMDTCGSEEYNTLLFSDPDEAWIFEIYGGHTYAAMRLPDDMVAVFGNQVMMGWADLNETDGYVFSPGLKAAMDRTANPVIDEQGRYHIAQTVDPGRREDFSNMRTWRGHQLLAPSTAGDYSADTFYPLLYEPDKKVSVLDVMKLFGDRYEGTPFDMMKPENDWVRPIGTPRQSCVHIIQTFDELPARACQVQWLTVGNAEHAIFVPAFSGITDTYEKYKVDDTSSRRINDGFYYLCKRICAVTETDRAHLSQGVKDYNLKQERAMLQEIQEAIPEIQKQYKWFKFVGDNYVTKLSTEFARRQYENALNLYDCLVYVQIDNVNDREDKDNFRMPYQK
ncbi:MAG: C69 family dipeptidase [Clostridia bacterium]|nr:C69 family dipeptidase [Clostridia bacterium]